MPTLTRAQWWSLALLVILSALVCVRAWVFTTSPRAHFDSDQAVIGLMAKDLAEGRAFPWFTYGRRYMLAVSAWFCAPLFAAFGLSVALLKLPLVAMNLAVVFMIWIGLRREPESTPAKVAMSILPFAVPGVIASSRLVEQGGGNIEPFVFLLSGFLLRKRPAWLGLNFGIAFLNREFALIGLVALLLMDLVQGRLLRRWRPYALTCAVLLIVMVAGRSIAMLSANYFGAVPEAGKPRLANIWGLIRQLSTLLGSSRTPLQSYNITSTLSVGHPFLIWVVAAWAIWVVIAQVRAPIDRLDGMSTYLVLVGVGQAAAYVLLSPIAYNPMLIRYTLLVVLTLVGAVAHGLRKHTLGLVTIAVVALLTFVNLRDHSALIHEYATRPPPDERENLARQLLARGIRYAIADYWLAYHVSFLNDERTIVEAASDGRIRRYSELIDAHAGEVRRISNEPCPGGEPIAKWYLCKPKP
jgi:hypothetical protein